jgi:hypothetical protein
VSSPARRLWFGAARPIELIIEAHRERVQVGTDGNWGEVEIVVFATKTVEIVLDLA